MPEKVSFWARFKGWSGHLRHFNFLDLKEEELKSCTSDMSHFLNFAFQSALSGLFHEVGTSVGHVVASGESMAFGHVLILFELVVYPVSNDCATHDSTNHFVFICSSTSCCKNR